MREKNMKNVSLLPLHLQEKSMQFEALNLFTFLIFFHYLRWKNVCRERSLLPEYILLLECPSMQGLTINSYFLTIIQDYLNEQTLILIKFSLIALCFYQFTIE